MSIRKLADGTVEADTPAEMREYLDSQPERDLRAVVSERDTSESARGTGFITPLLCFLPIKNRNWILTPLACFYRPANRR